MNAFAIVFHYDNPQKPDHYDLMLERGNSLKTWSVASHDFSRPAEAVQNFDHRKIYLEYEGPVSENRGFTKIFDRGTYADFSWTDKVIEVGLDGAKVRARILLTLVSENAGADSKWEIRSISC